MNGSVVDSVASVRLLSRRPKMRSTRVTTERDILNSLREIIREGGSESCKRYQVSKLPSAIIVGAMSSTYWKSTIDKEVAAKIRGTLTRTSRQRYWQGVARSMIWR